MIMKFMNFVLILILGSITTTTIIAQSTDYNDNGNYIAKGYDVVAYFDGQAKAGTKKYVYKYQNTKLKFSSQKNLNRFKKNPTKYLPQYGGYCAYAMGKDGSKVSVNPKTFEIRNGKLYLFYNAYLTNTLKSWKKEGAEQLRKKADKNWEKVKFKKK